MKPEYTFIFDTNSHFSRNFFLIEKNQDTSKPEHFYKGVPIFALTPLLKTVFTEIKIAKEYGYNFSNIVMIFDAPGKTFRDDLFSGYKANRPPKPDSFYQQLDLAVKMMECYGFPTLRVPGVESDDVIGTIASKLSKHKRKTVIFSGDKDILSLVDDNTLVFQGLSKKMFGISEVFAKLGVYPHQVIDYLTMTGDQVDGLGGIKGCGSKTACKLLEKYTLDELLRDPSIALDSGIRGIKGVVDEIANNKEHILLTRKLTTLKKDVNLNINLSEMVKKEQIDTNFLDFII